MQAAIDAAAICNDCVTKMVGAGSETQFAFRGTLQEEKPLRDWLQEVLMNCLGYYTFSFGKLQIGVRENCSVVEAFTEGNILFRSLQLAPVKPSFNHLTANFADQDFAFVNNSVAVYDIDHATLHRRRRGSDVPEVERQPLRHVHQEPGRADRQHPAARGVGRHQRSGVESRAPDRVQDHGARAQHGTGHGLLDDARRTCPVASGEFRVVSWRLNKDFSIDVQGRTTTDSMYDLVAGPKPADVEPTPVPEEILYDTGVPGIVTGTPMLSDYGTIVAGRHGGRSRMPPAT